MDKECTIKKSSQGITLDPRTKILLSIVISTVLISGKDNTLMLYVKGIISVIPIMLFVASGKLDWAIKLGSIFAVAYCGQVFLLPHTSGVVQMITVLFCGIFFRFLPGIMMGAYMLTTTKVSEFMAAMQRLHMPSVVSIPIAVMFRFFPTVKEEYGAIGDAMRMRGVRFGGGNVGKMLEYRLIPLMMSCVKIGDELSSAAVVRGLGAPIQRTNICKIGFKVQDFICLAVCFVALFLTIYFK